MDTNAYFLGLFCYESSATSPKTILKHLEQENRDNYEINALCFGDSLFIKFWEMSPCNKIKPYQS
jgi:hypothetical protein